MRCPGREKIGSKFSPPASHSGVPVFGRATPRNRVLTKTQTALNNCSTPPQPIAPLLIRTQFSARNLPQPVARLQAPINRRTSKGRASGFPVHPLARRACGRIPSPLIHRLATVATLACSHARGSPRSPERGRIASPSIHRLATVATSVAPCAPGFTLSSRARLADGRRLTAVIKKRGPCETRFYVRTFLK